MANKIYINPETTVVWTDAGGDAVLDLGANGGAGVVAVGAVLDLGASPRSEWYEWKLVVDGFDTAPVVGEKVDAYLSFSDQATAGREDGDVGVANGTAATDDLPNLKFVGSAFVQTTTAGDELIVSGVVRITSRYVIPVIHNDTADALLSTADAHRFELTPVPPEIQ